MKKKPIFLKPNTNDSDFASSFKDLMNRLSEPNQRRLFNVVHNAFCVGASNAIQEVQKKFYLKKK